MRTIIITTLVIGIVIATSHGFADGEIRAESVVSRVTVYGDRAEVTRTAEVKLAPGEHRVRFEPLPATLVPDSVRVSGVGSAKVKLGTVEIERTWRPERQAGLRKELETQIEALEDRLKELGAEEKVLAEKADFISSVESYSGEMISKSLAVSSEIAVDIGDMVGFVGSQRSGLVDRYLDIERERREINRQLEALRKQLAQVGGAAEDQSVAALVDVSAETAGELLLELTYVVPGASWRPVYNATLADDQKSVEIQYKAAVVQRTGEDWGNVQLRLSTAQPQIGATIPELPSLALRLTPPEPRKGVRLGFARAAFVPQEAKVVEDISAGAAVHEFRAYRTPAKVRTATVESKGISVLFDVPGREDIPSDGNEHKTTISAIALDAEPQHVAVPELSPHAFLKCEIDNESGLPLLPGKVNAFVAGNFVGASKLDAVAPGEKFELGFGVDQSVKVERKELRDVRGKTGIFRNKRRVVRGYEFTVKNYRKELANLTIIDQIPVSKDEDVKVSLTEVTLAPTQKGEDGLLEWRLLLRPGEETKFRFEYRIEYPKDRKLLGLD